MNSLLTSFLLIIVEQHVFVGFFYTFLYHELFVKLFPDHAHILQLCKI